MSGRCAAFEADTWAVIADPEICPHSRRQLEALHDLQVDLKGSVLCNDEKFEHSEACIKASHFPMLCNTATNKCFVGLRETCEDLEEIARLGA